jgi:hypothetical protein
MNTFGAQNHVMVGVGEIRRGTDWRPFDQHYCPCWNIFEARRPHPFLAARKVSTCPCQLPTTAGVSWRNHKSCFKSSVCPFRNQPVHIFARTTSFSRPRRLSYALAWTERSISCARLCSPKRDKAVTNRSKAFSPPPMRRAATVTYSKHLTP